MATTKKKAPAKKSLTPKKSSAAKARKTTYQSFRLYSDSEPFTRFSITRQTVYWIILVSFIVFAQLWILKLQIEVATLIEAQQSELQDF